MVNARVIKKLKSNNKMSTQEEITNFREGIEQLRGKQIDEKLAGQLLQVITDQTQHKEIMWSLVHLVESIDLSLYVHTLINLTSDMKNKAPLWLGLLYARILNTPDARSYLREIIKHLSREQYTLVETFLLQLCDQIEVEDGKELGDKFKTHVNSVFLK